MQLIRCTKKLQKEMGLTKEDVQTEAAAPSFLGSWHANLLFIDRKKCVLFTNDKTLFNFVVLDVRKAELRKLDVLFRRYLQTVLAEEAMAESVRQRILSEYTTIAYANTNNRKVLGSMNDLAYQYKYAILENGGVHSAMVPSLIKQFNRMPMGMLNYQYPIDALLAVYGEDCV